MAASTFLWLPSIFSYNISLYALIPVWFLGFSAQEIKLVALGDRYNNNKPRDPTVFRPGDSEDYKHKMDKLAGMHQNGMETFPLFVAAVLAGNVARLPTEYLNSFSIFFVSNRIIYDIIYFSQASFASNSARTATYVAGMLGCLWVLAVAGGASSTK